MAKKTPPGLNRAFAYALSGPFVILVMTDFSCGTTARERDFIIAMYLVSYVWAFMLCFFAILVHRKRSR